MKGKIFFQIIIEPKIIKKVLLNPQNYGVTK